MFEFLTVAFLFLVIDIIFIRLYMAKHFGKLIKSVQGSKMETDMLGAVLSYTLLIFGLYYFVIRDRRPLIDSFIFGFVMYGVYEATSYALLKNWTIDTMIKDSLWGGTICLLVTFIVYKLFA
tara:strand:- start:5526 stop:5891 length:366 start_codon:yes stop_codon:yes gene_type:complete